MMRPAPLRYLPGTDSIRSAELEVYVKIGGAGGRQEAEDARHNLDRRQPAFWTLATYSDAPAGSLLYYANHFAGVENGIEAYHNDFPPHCPDIGEARFLDTLVPLNDAAVTSLQAAYELVGTFRSKAELVKRGPRSLGLGAPDPVESIRELVRGAA